MKAVKKSRDEVSVAASHELAEMLVDPAINLWALGPEGRLYSYEVCDAVEEETFPVRGIPMSDFVYPAYFELFRKPSSAKFDHMNKIRRPFEILRMGYAQVREGCEPFELMGSKAKETKFKNEDRADHRSEYRKALYKRKPVDTTKFKI